jgi:hypothetical protein
MRINPRQNILDMWRAYAKTVRPGGAWTWGEKDNSVADAEQLLILLYPATELEGFAFNQPDVIERDVLEALKDFGEARKLSRLVLDLIGEFLSRNTDENGEAVFSCGTYLRVESGDGTPTAEQQRLDTVEAYSISLTLCLSATSFLKYFTATVSPEVRAKIDALSEGIRKRLTSAMVGLLRSFCLNNIETGTPDHANFLRMLNQGRSADLDTTARLGSALESIRVQIPELTIGLQGGAIDPYREPGVLFECGWTWGVADNAADVELAPEEALVQSQGYAVPRPSIYFTSQALDGLADLFSERTLRLDILTPGQQRLYRALELRWNLAQRYWSTLARFGDGKWPLEDIPWLTTEGQESVYFSMLVFSILRRDRVSRRISDDELTRAVGVLEQAAVEGRITQRLRRDDPSLGLHDPGVQLRLLGSEAAGGPPLIWIAVDFAAGLAKRCVEAAELTGQPPTRERLFTIAETAMDHLWKRRLREGDGTGLWDNLPGAFPGVTDSAKSPSWTFTERMMEFLVATSKAYTRSPMRTQRLYEDALGLIYEAEHTLGRELAESSEDRPATLNQLLSGIQAEIKRARRIVSTQPGTASGILYEVLRELDKLQVARLNVEDGR